MEIFKINDKINEIKTKKYPTKIPFIVQSRCVETDRYLVVFDKISQKYRLFH